LLAVERAYLNVSRGLSALLCVLGVAIVVSTFARGGGALAFGVLLGCGLLALGAGRLWLARGAGSSDAP
jgi:hypothetical protein